MRQESGLYVVGGGTGSARAVVARAIVTAINAAGCRYELWNDGVDARCEADYAAAVAASARQAVVVVVHGNGLSGVRDRLQQLGRVPGESGIRAILVTALTRASLPDADSGVCRQTLLSEYALALPGKPFTEADWEPLQTLGQDLVRKLLHGQISRGLFDVQLKPIALPARQAARSLAEDLGI